MALLTQRERQALAAMMDQHSGYFGLMEKYLEDFIHEGVKEGRFTQQQADEDLELALERSYALNNLSQYLSYCQAIEVLEKARAQARGNGTFYYRLSVALMHCGRLQEALKTALQGIEEEPSYPWSRLQAAKLLAHFGRNQEALAQIDAGLKLVPRDYEFTALTKEILSGASLTTMAGHHIDPKADEELHSGEGRVDEQMEKIFATNCILVDEAALERIHRELPLTDWRQDHYFVAASLALTEKHTVAVLFRMNEAGLSHMALPLLQQLCNVLRHLPPSWKHQPEEITAVWVDQDATLTLVCQVNKDQCTTTAIPAARWNRILLTLPEGLTESERAHFTVLRELAAKENYAAIAAYLPSIEEKDLTPALAGEIAQAFINWGELGEYDKFRQSLTWLDRVREKGAQDFRWNLRYGNALFCLDRETEAFPYLEKARQLAPNDTDVLDLTGACLSSIAFPRPGVCFAERCRLAWQRLRQAEAALPAARADNAHELLTALRTALRDIDPGWQYSAVLDPSAQHCELVISPSSRAQIFSLLTFLRSRPQDWPTRLELKAGIPARTSFAPLEIDQGRALDPQLLTAWFEEKEDGWWLYLYDDELSTISPEESDEIFPALRLLACRAVSECVVDQFIARFVIARSIDEKAQTFPFPEVAERFHRLVPASADWTYEKSIEQTYSYWEKPAEDPHNCDMYCDVGEGEEHCVQLLNEYFRNVGDEEANLRTQGTVGGFFFFRAADEKTAKKVRKDWIAQLSKQLSAVASSTPGIAACAVTGWAVGEKYCYVDVLAWDAKPTYAAAAQFFQQEPALIEAGFHCWQRRAGSVLFLDPEREAAVAASRAP